MNNPERLVISQLNGSDLSQFADEIFDMAVTYSVLHHVPDYMAAVRELVRVVKPGGVIYIDHEVCPAYWEISSEYQSYCREVAASRSAAPVTFFQRAVRLVRRSNRWRYLLTAFRVRLQQVTDEGDIHVYDHDHIEWLKVRGCLESSCDILIEQDYLVCREREFPAPIWSVWRSRCVDMRMIVARKR
jgi:SAM-dependent methyltransferase